MSEETVRPFCPRCEPDTDQTKELVYVNYCHAHKPDGLGSEDILVSDGPMISGTEESGGLCNRDWGDFFHRSGKLLKGGRRKR